MAYVNTVANFIAFVNDSKNSNPLTVSAEAPENCGHGSHKNYFQGIMTCKSKDNSGNNINRKYLIIGYENTISEEDIKNILTSNNYNDKRDKSKNTASSRGLGLKSLMLHFGKHVTIYSEGKNESNNKFYTYYDWSINKHIMAIEKLKNEKQDDEINLIANNYINKSSTYDEDEIIPKIAKITKKIKKVCSEKKIDYPKTLIIILLRNKYQVSVNDTNEYEIDNIQNELMNNIFPKKYADLDINIYYLKENKKLTIEKIKKLDIVGKYYKQDCINFKIKHCYEDCIMIKYTDTGKNQPYYFVISKNGGKRVRNLQNLSDKDGSLIKDIKSKYITYINEWDDDKISYEVEYYGLRWDKIMKDGLEKIFKNPTYAGVYILFNLMNINGKMLLNDKPIPVNTIFKSSKDYSFKSIQSIGGHFFRCTLNVINKDECIIMKPNRSESELKVDCSETLGAIHNALNRFYYEKEWRNNGTSIMKDRKESEYVNGETVKNILFESCLIRKRDERFFIKNKNDMNNTLNVREKKKKKRKEYGTWYSNFYEKKTENEDECIIEYIIKEGTCKEGRESQRRKENNINFRNKGFTCISSIEINKLQNMKNEIIENYVREYWSDNSDKYCCIIIRNHQTDSCNVYDYEHWIEFKNKMAAVENLIHNLDVQSDNEIKKIFLGN